MTQARSSDSPPNLAPEVPGLGPRALQGRRDRPGFAAYIPGECLKVDSKLWTPEQREGGIFVRGAFLSASEEEEAIAEAGRENRMVAVGIYQIKKSFVAIADAGFQPDEHGDPQPFPGPWKAIPALELRPYWEELGPQGRSLYAQAYQTAHMPSEAAREVALRSFRTIA
jgi:hypothetical protein